MSKIPLTDAQLRAKAPSIFAESPIKGVSNRYAFVPTYKIINTFREAGYYPISAGETKVRNINNNGYQKHFLQFRSISNLLRPNSKEEYADIVLVNDHSAKSSFKLILSYWRIVCSNMLFVPSYTFTSTSIIHSGYQDNKIQDAITEVTQYMPKMEKEIKQFKSINLSEIEQHSLAMAALDLRFDTKVHKINPDELLKIHRVADSDSSLWNIFNRLQEGIIRGGIKGENIETGRTFTSKAINSIDTNLALNQELWSTIRMMAGLKTREPEMAIAA